MGAGERLSDGGVGKRAVAAATAGRAGGQGRCPGPADQSIPGHQYRPAIRRRASPSHRTGYVGRREHHANTQYGDGRVAPPAAGCTQRRLRDGGRGRLSAARRHVRLQRARQISSAAAGKKETEKEVPQVRRERGYRATSFEPSERRGGEGRGEQTRKGRATRRLRPLPCLVPEERSGGI